MITLQASRFIVDYDESECKYHVYTMDYRKGVEEITDKLTTESKDELIEDLIYALKQVLKENKE